MPQVSKRFIKEEKLKKILDLFLETIVTIENKTEANNILSELLTPTEKIMIAKRVTGFYLILNNKTNQEISDLIKLSTSTVSYLRKSLLHTNYLKKYLESKLFLKRGAKMIQSILFEILFTVAKGARLQSNPSYTQLKKHIQEPL